MRSAFPLVGAAAVILGLLPFEATAQARRPLPPGAVGPNRCTVYDPAVESMRDVIVHSGRRVRSFAVCIERGQGQRVRVTLDRRRTRVLVSSPAKVVCEDVRARLIRLRIDKEGPPTVSSCPAL